MRPSSLQDGVCLCHTKFIGVACLASVNNCPGSCSGHGTCNTGTRTCTCNAGYGGADCASFCPKQCTRTENGLSSHGRCTVDFKCACKDGYSGPDCSQVCPGRCTGHGECVDGVCSCREGYTGLDCSQLAKMTAAAFLLDGVLAYQPHTLVM